MFILDRTRLTDCACKFCSASLSMRYFFVFYGAINRLHIVKLLLSPLNANILANIFEKPTNLSRECDDIFCRSFEKCRYRMRKNFFICLENCQATAPSFCKNLFSTERSLRKCSAHGLNPFCSIWTRSLKSAFFSMRETYERDMPHFSAISFWVKRFSSPRP